MRDLHSDGREKTGPDLFSTAQPVTLAFTNTRMEYALVGIEDVLRYFDLRFAFGPVASDFFLGNPRGPFS